MNDKGLVYVHHGVTQTAQTQGKKPRYGLQSDIAIRHTLRYADNAKEAVEMTLSYETTGDFAGGGYYGTGGFWVDERGHAFVIEKSDPSAIIRKPGDVGEEDFMYATNTLLSKELGSAEQEYVEHGGWLNKGVAPCRDFSVSRNLFVYNLFSDYHGQIDIEFMKMVWRFRSGPLPVRAHPDEWEKKALAHYERDDDCMWWATLGHVTNAYVTITVPEDKLYLLSTTSAAQNPTLSHPKAFHGARWLANATRAFFSLKLASSPVEVMKAVKYQAETDLFLAERELRKLDYENPAYAPLDDIFNQAVIEWTKGDFWRGPERGFTLTKKSSEEEEIYHLSKATRAFVRCQLLARKVYNALVPPATKPSDLGLKPWEYEPPAKNLPK
jgi:hypothetical protein